MPVRIIICKARRAGLSTGVESIIFDDTITHANTYSLILANERNPSENILSMCRRFWEHMPEHMRVPESLVPGGLLPVRPPLPPQFKNSPPKDRIEFAPPLNSKLLVATARSLDAYLGFGFQNCHATEAAYYVDAENLFRALYPTISKKPHSSLYIESTPNGQEGKGAWFYHNCMDAYSRKKTQYGEMSLLFIPWHEMAYSFAIPFDDEEARIGFSKTLTVTETDLLRRFPYISMEQLRWRRMMLAGPTFNGDEDFFCQEFPEDLATAFLTSGVSVFTRKAIKRLINKSRPPIWEGDVYWGDSPKDAETETIHDLIRRPKLMTPLEARDAGFEPHDNDGCYENLKIFRYPKKGERVFVCGDVGQGNPNSKDPDYSTLCVGVLNDFDRDELIMTWRGHINPILFGEVAAALCWAIRYTVGEKVQMPELVPEWTGPGAAMCSYIDKKGLYPMLYRYQDFVKVGAPPTRTIGWESNTKTKPIMVSYTCRMVENDHIDVPDEELVTQMSTYKQLDSFGDSASYGGAGGRHDDLVSAFQILCVLLRLRSQVFGAEAEEVGDTNDFTFEEYDESDIPWDPFQPVGMALPGFQKRDVDEESLEEDSKWW